MRYFIWIIFLEVFLKFLKNKPSKDYNKKNIILVYLNMFGTFFISDYNTSS